jgi:hypothetical protein
VILCQRRGKVLLQGWKGCRLYLVWAVAGEVVQVVVKKENQVDTQSYRSY